VKWVGAAWLVFSLWVALALVGAMWGWW